MSLKALPAAHKEQNEHGAYKKATVFGDKAPAVFAAIVIPAIDRIIETFRGAGYTCERRQELYKPVHNGLREHAFFSAGYRSCIMQVDAFPNYLTERFMFEIAYSNRHNLALALTWRRQTAIGSKTL